LSPFHGRSLPRVFWLEALFALEVRGIWAAI
jgi:hypothetical protein